MQKFQLLVICVKTIIYLLLYNLHDCTFKSTFQVNNRVVIGKGIEHNSTHHKPYKPELSKNNSDKKRNNQKYRNK